LSSGYEHRPVLLEESIALLEIGPGSVVVDGTLGSGGHAARILEESAPDGLVVGLDVDDDALEAARQRLRPFGDRVRLVRSSFRALRDVLSDLGIDQLDAVLLDLGVSSHQLDRANRGFRFTSATAEATPLDMRMDRRSERTAAVLLRTASSDELADWFQRYGELPGARRLARAIVDARREAPLRTTEDLLRVIRAARAGSGRRHHPATLVFQALRIVVNDELAALDEGIDAAIEALRPGGRAAVIAYHSLEDRIVKQRFRNEERGCICPPRTPICVCGRLPRLRVITRRPVRPGPDEVRANPRARSARLRAAERVAEAA
jgi:16S rRNA (cytosine1402-N4)-methyltransferase